MTKGGYESGYYPPGAEFDPRAPWNEKDPPMWSCGYCGEEFPDIEDHSHFEALDGDTCCYSCLPEALDYALVEVKKLREEIRKEAQRIRQPYHQPTNEGGDQ